MYFICLWIHKKSRFRSDWTVTASLSPGPPATRVLATRQRTGQLNSSSSPWRNHGFLWSRPEWLCPEQLEKKGTTLSRTVHTRRGGSPDPGCPRLLKYIPVCIVFVLCMYCITIRANTDLIHSTTIHTTIHAQYIWFISLVFITMHANPYQHTLACIMLIFGMYEIIIHANTDQIHAFF